MDDREHRKLIEKLVAAKTSEERGRIFQDLAARDKAASAASEMNEAVGAGKPDEVEPAEKKGEPVARQEVRLSGGDGNRRAIPHYTGNDENHAGATLGIRCRRRLWYRLCLAVCYRYRCLQ